MHGDVKIRLSNGFITSGRLLDFMLIPISVPTEDTKEEFEDSTFLSSPKFIVYGIVETDEGSIMARQLSEIKRKHFKPWEKS